MAVTLKQPNLVVIDLDKDCNKQGPPPISLVLTTSGGSPVLVLVILTMLEPVVGTVATCFETLPGSLLAASAFNKRVFPHPPVPTQMIIAEQSFGN